MSQLHQHLLEGTLAGSKTLKLGRPGFKPCSVSLGQCLAVSDPQSSEFAMGMMILSTPQLREMGHLEHLAC